MNEQKVTNLNDEEVKDLNPVFDLFVDRTQSLLERGKGSMLLRRSSEALRNYKSFRISAYWASSVKYQMDSPKE